MRMVAMHAKSTNVGYVDTQEWSTCGINLLDGMPKDAFVICIYYVKKLNIRVSLVEGKIYKSSFQKS